MKYLRTCHFCNFTAEYDEFPEGSVVFCGICACGECLENGKAKDFNQLVESELMLDEAAFVDEIEVVDG